MQHVIELILYYKYLIILPISILEGPIIAIICGFLSTLGQINIFLAYVIIVIGDAIGDAGCYFLGRWGQPLVHKHGPKVGISHEKVESVREYFLSNHKKALFFSKVLHGIGFVGLIVAGNLKVPYRKFFITTFSTTLVQYIILFTIGILFGHAYNQIATYLNYYTAASVVIVLFVGLYIFARKFNVLINRE